MIHFTCAFLQIKKQKELEHQVPECIIFVHTTITPLTMYTMLLLSLSRDHFHLVFVTLAQRAAKMSMDDLDPELTNVYIGEGLCLFLRWGVAVRCMCVCFGRAYSPPPSAGRVSILSCCSCLVFY